MQKVKQKIIAVLLLAFTMVGTLGVNTNAMTVAPNSLSEMSTSLDDNGRVYKYLKGIPSTGLWNYNRPTVIVGSQTLSVKGVVINGTYYIPFRSASSMIAGSTYSYDSRTKTATMTSPTKMPKTPTMNGYRSSLNNLKRKPAPSSAEPCLRWTARKKSFPPPKPARRSTIRNAPAPIWWHWRRNCLKAKYNLIQTSRLNLSV